MMYVEMAGRSRCQGGYCDSPESVLLWEEMEKVGEDG